MHIALATCHEESTLFHDEEPLVEALKKRGATVYPVVWNSPEIEWAAYDVVVVRNTWDYHQQTDTFRAWLNLLETLDLVVINAPDLIRWNIDKSYLGQLLEHSIQTIPTVFAQGRDLQLSDVLSKQGWSQAVVKPIISASGDNTWIVTSENAEQSQQKFEWLNNVIGMMIQPLVSQIKDEGEYSLVFFDGEYSHGILKKTGDSFLVHEEQGGSINTVDIAESLITDAQKVVKAVQGITGILPNYVRVDGVRDEDNLIVMEVECIEPELYFKRSDTGAERFAKIILEAIQ